MSFIEFRNVVFYYNDDAEANTRPTIDGVSFSVEKGEVVAIIESPKPEFDELCPKY